MRNEFLEKLYAFWRMLSPFVERDEHIFCEVIRMDATRKLIEREEPELLKKVNDPSAKEALYAYMKKAEKENETYLIRPLPGDADFFQKMFSVYMDAEDTVAFLNALFEILFFKSYYLPREVCQKAFEIAEEHETLHVFYPEVFLSCFPEQLRKLKEKRIRLYPGPLMEKGVYAFFRYLSKGNPKVTIPDEEEFSPGDLVIMTSIFTKAYPGWELPRRKDFLPVLKSPDGVRFFIVFPRNFFTSAKLADLKRRLTTYRIEKLIFFGKDLSLSNLGALVLTKEKAGDYRAEVILSRQRKEVSRSELEIITLWNPELLLADEREEILEFFQKTPKIPLGEVASIMEGCFLPELKELEDEAEDYTHRLLVKEEITGKSKWVDIEKLPKVQLNEKIASKCPSLKPGDLVVNTSSYYLPVKEIPPTREKILPGKYVMVIRPRKYPSSLLRLFLSSEIGRALMISLHIHFPSSTPLEKRLMKLSVPKLSPGTVKALAENLQKAEEERLRKIQEAEEKYRSQRKRLEREIILRGAGE